MKEKLLNMNFMEETRSLFLVFLHVHLIVKVTKKIDTHKIPKKGRKGNGSFMEWYFMGISLIWLI